DRVRFRSVIPDARAQSASPVHVEPGASCGGAARHWIRPGLGGSGAGAFTGRWLEGWASSQGPRDGGVARMSTHGVSVRARIHQGRCMVDKPMKTRPRLFLIDGYAL